MHGTKTKPPQARTQEQSSPRDLTDPLPPALVYSGSVGGRGQRLFRFRLHGLPALLQQPAAGARWRRAASVPVLPVQRRMPARQKSARWVGLGPHFLLMEVVSELRGRIHTRTVCFSACLKRAHVVSGRSAGLCGWCRLHGRKGQRLLLSRLEDRVVVVAVQ